MLNLLYFAPIWIGLAAVIAHSRGRSWFAWALWSLVLGPFALIPILALPRIERPQTPRPQISTRDIPTIPVTDAAPVTDLKQCPYCAEDIRTEAIKCRFCGSMLTARVSRGVNRGLVMSGVAMLLATAFVVLLAAAGWWSYSDGTLGAALPIWNSLVSVALIVVSIGLFRGRAWAWNWGVTSAILNGVSFGFQAIWNTLPPEANVLLWIGVVLQGFATIVLIAARKEFPPHPIVHCRKSIAVGAGVFVLSLLVLLGVSSRHRVSPVVSPVVVAASAPAAESVAAPAPEKPAVVVTTPEPEKAAVAAQEPKKPMPVPGTKEWKEAIRDIRAKMPSFGERFHIEGRITELKPELGQENVLVWGRAIPADGNFSKRGSHLQNVNIVVIGRGAERVANYHWGMPFYADACFTMNIPNEMEWPDGTKHDLWVYGHCVAETERAIAELNREEQQAVSVPQADAAPAPAGPTAAPVPEKVAAPATEKAGAPRPSGDSDALGVAEARSFVVAWVKASATATKADDILSLYASEVDYYRKGVVTKSDVEQDKAAYFKRWPDRRAVIDGEVRVAESGTALVKTVSFAYTYSVQSGARQARGRASTTLVLQKLNGAIVIAKEDGAVEKTER